ncbi:MAG: arsenate reductase ArsC [Thermoleophilaceae bacterium]|nr:arsenate reductase ArsC [Thermoleophilaceae bacterium]
MKTVLFVCTHNAGRSQMAEALFGRHAPPDLRAESAGQQPARHVWPPVLEAMREIGIDLGDRRPKKLTIEMQLHADWGVTLACGGTCPYVPTTVEDWDIPDPADRPIEDVRMIRDAIEARVRDLIEQRADLIRVDRTGHQLRLEKLLPDLVREFGATRSDEEIRAAADAVLLDYQDAPVRSFVMALAHRRVREVLQGERDTALMP